MKEMGILIAKGNTAEVFEYENHKVCKLFRTGYPREYVELEYRNAHVMYQEGLPVPMVYEIVERNSRCGIIYERVQGESLYNLFLQDREAAFEKFIHTQREFLKQESKELLSYKDFMMESMKRADFKGEDLIEKILKLPDGDSICHGDFHPGNVMVKADGTVVVIDFMNVCRGRWEYDVARTYVILSEVDKGVADEYLLKFDVEYEQIAEYIDIVRKYRKFELR
ncbi:MAG: aminoglycoside phosphotransferase family protein [Lachnospiraceae bacterium]|nr:aminoglycoside phosphotransferase family protein [Lachnospiraceae bacterium]